MSIDAIIPPVDFPLSPPLDPEWTLEDLQTHLGGVPIHRIRLWPSPGTATEADLLRTKNCELLDGVLVEKPMGWVEMLVATKLLVILDEFVVRHDLGLVFGDNTKYRVTKRRVRLPDVSYFRWEHFPNRKGPASKTLPFGPDLVVEVLSDSNTVNEMDRKRKEFFAAGTKLFWMIEPELRTIDVYTASTDPVHLTEADTLDGGDVLPGFVLPIRELFARIPPVGDDGLHSAE